ncbi:unnamed protein product [Leptidea sinapis]|uniref:SH3 domain-containing protein n=1 Tax=Leptidea sinapis TaxID=189913 RepID=A0A5E4PUY2_9NEOP|nr:unnamed protein product [Leptidea sinapis]
MIVLKVVLFITIFATFECRLPDKVFCANELCDAPISKAKTLLNYNSPENDLISFKSNSEAVIFMKSAGINRDLWYAKINGVSGFVSSKFLRENKVFTRELVELPLPPIPEKTNVTPNKVLQPHEVFEGTTIYTTESSDSSANIESATTSQPLQSSPETPALSADINISDNLNIGDSKSSAIPNNIEAALNELATESKPISKEILNEPMDSMENDDEVDISTDDNSEEDYNDDKIESDATLLNTSPEPILPPKDKNIHTDKLLLETSKENNLAVEKNNVLEQNLPQSVTQLIVDDNMEGNTSVKTEKKVEEPKNIENVVVTQASKPANINNQNVVVIDKEIIQTPATNNIKEKEVIQNINNLGSHSSVEHVEQLKDSNNMSEHNNIKISSSTPQEPVDIKTETETTPVTTSESSMINTESEQSSSPQTIPAADISLLLKEMHSHNTGKEETPQQIEPVEHYVTTQPEISSVVPEAITESPIIESTTESITESYVTQSMEESSIPVTNSYLTMSTEDIIEEVFNTPTTESTPPEENTEGFLSSIYTTIADMIPPTTEGPPSENIFNPKYVQEDSIREPTESSYVMTYLLSIYKSVMGIEESAPHYPPVAQSCFTDEYCDGESHGQRNRLLTFLLTTASSVLLFILGYYYIDNKRQDSKFIGKINKLQRELLFASKECEILKEELTTTKNKLSSIEDSSFGMDDMVQSLKDEINEMKAQNDRLRNSLDDNEKLLRVSENTAGELQNTLSEVENTLSELLYASAENALEEFKKQKKQLEEVNQKLSQSNNRIELQRHEIIALKDTIKELKSGGSANVDVNSLIDHTEIKAKLAKALEENATITAKYDVSINKEWYSN